jgi:peptidoglycan/xylan/chitin deacetylase (PgdA/CDA1 family)
MYHAMEERTSAISIPPERFAWQMARLHEDGYQPVTLGRLMRSFRDGGETLVRPVVITFDDGFESVYTQAWPVLERYGFAATVFLVAGHCGKRNDWPTQPPTAPCLPLMDWRQIQEMSRHGIEFGGHTFTHPRLDELNPREQVREIVDSRTELEDRLGTAVATFAYPYGRLNQSAKDLVGETYQAACGTGLGLAGNASDPFELERIEIQCVQTPALFRRLSSPACGLYLRILRPVRTARAVLAGHSWR